MYYGFFTSNVVKATNSEVTGFEIEGAGEMYFAFSVGGVWMVPDDGKGKSIGNVSFETLLTRGISRQDLETASFSFLNGKRFLIAVAVGDSVAPPKFKLSVKMAEAGVQKTKVVESGEYNLHGDIQSIDADNTDNVTIEVSGYKNGRWLPYVTLENAGTSYEKIKFKATLTVNELGEKAELKSVTLKAQPKDIVIPSDEVSIYTKRPLKDAKVYVVGNNKGIVKAFCSSTTPAQWREIERLTETSFDGANGILKLTLTQDGEEVPEIEGLVIQE